MNNYALFTLKITLLTPLHIGNGVTLLNEYDYTVANNRTWRINDSALLEAQNVIDDPILADKLAQTPPAQLISPSDFNENSKFFRYSIRGIPRSLAEGAHLKEQIKNIYDEVYIPGSCVKGAIRTALAWYASKKINLEINVDDLKPDPRFAAQPIEHILFVQQDAKPRHEPNYELLKALQISDSKPLNTNCLTLVNAAVIKRESGMNNSIPVEIEAIKKETNFEMSLKIDLALFSEWAQSKGLRLSQKDWLTKLPSTINEFTANRVKQEIRYYENNPRLKQAHEVYKQLENAVLKGNQFILQLGWGTGWDGMTLGSYLKKNPTKMEQILLKYRKQMVKGNRQKNSLYPKSRRLQISAEKTQYGEIREKPGMPLGWILVEMVPNANHFLVGWDAVEKQYQPLISYQQNDAHSLNKISPSKSENPQAKPKPDIKDPLLPSDKNGTTKIISKFSHEPKVGDIFIGMVEYIEESGTILVKIPGTGEVLGEVKIKDNLKRLKPKIGSKVFCQVIDAIYKDKNGDPWLPCKLIKA